MRVGIGEIVSLASPDRGTWTFGRDATGRLVTTTDPRGMVGATTYSYNGWGEVTGKAPRAPRPRALPCPRATRINPARGCRWPS